MAFSFREGEFILSNKGGTADLSSVLYLEGRRFIFTGTLQENALKKKGGKIT